MQTGCDQDINTHLEPTKFSFLIGMLLLFKSLLIIKKTTKQKQSKQGTRNFWSIFQFSSIFFIFSFHLSLNNSCNTCTRFSIPTFNRYSVKQNYSVSSYYTMIHFTRKGEMKKSFFDSTNITRRPMQSHICVWNLI